MIYLVNPSTRLIRADIEHFKLGAIMTPGQGNSLPADGLYAIDNGCGPTVRGEPGSGYPGDERYLAMLARLREAEGSDPCNPDESRCLFAVAPDVLADAVATLRRSAYMLGWIRYLGFPAALVAQNGQEHLPVPWDDIDALFLGGSAECVPCRYIRPATREERSRKHCPSCGRKLIEWKLGPAARDLVAEARARRVWVHMGRVNSLKRLRYAAAIGCDSADGTHVTNAPDKNLKEVRGWAYDVDRQLTFWEAA